jgi:hypothetical protein
LNFVDLGVQIFPDTKAPSARPYWPFQVDVVNFVKRFAGNESINYAHFAGGDVDVGRKYLVDLVGIMGHPFYVDLTDQAPTPAFGIALGGMLQLLTTRYPWLSAGVWPNPIPAELTVSFKSWMDAHPTFAILAPLIQQFTSGLGPFQEVAAVYMLAVFNPIVINFFVSPNTAFRVNGGCTKIYDGIAAYLGAGNVALSTTVTDVHRKDNGKVQLRGTNTVTNVPFYYICGDVVVAFPQTTDNLAAWDLDTTEQALFSNIDTRFYWWGTADVTGSAVAGAFNMNMANLIADPYLNAPYPSMILLNRESDDQRPAGWYACSGIQKLNTTQITPIVTQDFEILKSLHLLDSYNITSTHRHTYQPFVTNVTALATSPTFYAQVANIQGRRHTYWVGAAISYAATYMVWEDTYKLVQAFFP